MTDSTYRPATDGVGAPPSYPSGDTSSAAGSPNSDSPSATDVAKHGTQAASDVAKHGKQAASDVAGTATGAARDVAQETKAQASDLLGKSKQELNTQVQAQQGSIVQNLRSLVGQLNTMTEHADDDGTAVRAAGAIRDRAQSAADWLDGRDPADVADELRSVGRQRPGAFLLGALVAGVAAGRLTRGVVETHTTDSDELTSGHDPSLGAGARDGAPQPTRDTLPANQPSSLGRPTP